MLSTLFRAFFDICRFRLRPQDLPASPELLSLTMAAYLLTNAGLTMISQPPAAAFSAGLVEVTVVAVLTWVVLLLRRFANRWMQTMSALAGTGVVFSVLALPLYVWLEPRSDPDIAAGAAPVYLLVLALILWNVAVIGHILRHALSAPFALGVLVSLAYLVVVTSAVTMVLPAGTP